MAIRVSKLVDKMPPSGIRVFFDLVIGMKDVISLGVGEPDFITPWNIRERAIDAIEQGYTSYTSNKGLIELRRDISRYLKRRYGLDYDPQDEILITVGVSEAFDLALRALIDRGDKVLVPEPSYVSYGPLTTLCGGTPVFMKTGPDSGFRVSAGDVSRSCDARTKALILNYPNNPTGASYSRQALKEMAKVVARKDLIMISDEIYCDLTYDYAHTPFPSLPRMKERTVYLNGFSKSFAMTGWRIGYACGPERIISAMTKIHQYTMLCASIISQLAACEALAGGEKAVSEMRREYRRRREFVISRLNEIGLVCHKPEGAFYAFPSIRELGLPSLEFARRLLKSEKVAVVPGTAFGSTGEGYIRISYASDMENLKEALVRMERFVSNFK